MGQQNRAILTTELSQQITACAFSKDDLRILCEILQESSHAAAEEEIVNYTPLDQPMEQILANREVLRLGFELQVTVRGIDDKVLSGTIPAVFSSPRFPDKVKTLYINSELGLKTYTIGLRGTTLNCCWISPNRNFSIYHCHPPYLRQTQVTFSSPV